MIGELPVRATPAIKAEYEKHFGVKIMFESSEAQNKQTQLEGTHQLDCKPQVCENLTKDVLEIKQYVEKISLLLLELETAYERTHQEDILVNIKKTTCQFSTCANIALRRFQSEI